MWPPLEEEDLAHAGPGFLGLAAAAFLGVVLAAVLAVPGPSPAEQHVLLTVKALGPDGEPVGLSRVEVYAIDAIASGGPRLLASADAGGRDSVGVGVVVPRKPMRIMSVYEVVDGETVLVEKPVYRPVNLLVVGVSYRERMIGAAVVAVDPTVLDWPHDRVEVVLRMGEPVLTAGEAQGVPRRGGGLRVVAVWLQETPVLRYAAWYGISASYTYEYASRVEVESKALTCAATGCEDEWEPAGSSLVAIDVGLEGGGIEGPVERTVYFTLHYALLEYCDSFLGLCEYIVAAHDTAADPYMVSYSDKTWGGVPPSGGSEQLVPSGTTVSIPVTGGYHWEFTVSISPTPQWPPLPVVALGVSRAPEPVSFLHIAGEERPPGYYVRVVSPNGNTYVQAYASWAYLPP